MTPSDESWKHGYPADYVTANAICLHDEFDPDANRSIRVGFRSGYYPDAAYRRSLPDRIADALDESWNRLMQALRSPGPGVERRASQPALRPALPREGSVAALAYDGPAPGDRLITS